MRTHSPVSEAEDTAAILCVEPLASSSSAPRLLLLLASTVNLSPWIFRKWWSPSGVQNPGLNVSLQASLYCRATLYLWLPPTPFPSSYCHSTSLHLFYNQLSSTRPLLADNAVFLSCLFHCIASPLLLCLFTSSRRDQGLCNRGSQIQPCCSRFRRMSCHFLRQIMRCGSSHLLIPHSSSSNTVCRLQSEDR